MGRVGLMGRYGGGHISHEAGTHHGLLDLSCALDIDGLRRVGVKHWVGDGAVLWCIQPPPAH